VARAWKGTGRSSTDKKRLEPGKEVEKRTDKKRLEPGKELEDQVWIRDGWNLERKWKIKCG
jgi:hypothetical protein